MDWLLFLEEEKSHLEKILTKVKNKSKTFYPSEDKIFRVFNVCNKLPIKVVILGMDPYINKGQANGLCFAVEEDFKIPPSLKNIFKVSETKNEDKTLLNWANQGVFLLNTVLTVEEGKSGSHKNIGWQNFTNKVINKISNDCDNVVFMLWGSYAQSLEDNIDSNKHYVLKSTHPSPLGCRRENTKCGDAFMNCNHFNKANTYLESKGIEKIQW